MADLVYIDPPVWDTVCTFGRYQHETINGDPCITVHDATTCKVMLDDFAAHPGNDIFYDKQHEIVDELGPDAVDDAKLREWAAGDGHAMAWANAMVMIIGGQVARYEAHPGAPQQPPDAQEILMQSDGSLRPDGVYCRRYALTPRGSDPIAGMSAFRSTSPFFVPEKDGHRLLNLTVTNDPRMRDCALAFQRQTGRAVAMSRIKGQAMANPQYRSKADDMLQRAKETKRSAEQAASDLESKGREWSAGAKSKMATASPDEKRQIQDEARAWQQRMATAKEASRLAISAVDQATSAWNLSGTMSDPATLEQKQQFEVWERRLAEVLRDVESTKGRALRMENSHMDPKDAAVMTAAGVGPDDSPEEKLHKMTAYARQMEEQRCAEEARKQEEARKAEEARKQEGAPVVPVKQADPPFGGKESPEEEAGEHVAIKALQERIAALEAALGDKTAEDESMRATMKRMEEERRMEEARKFSRGALAMGRFYDKHKGDASKTEEWLTAEHRKNPAAAEALLSPENTYKNAPSEAVVMQRMTRGGTGIGAPDPALNVPSAPTAKHAAQARFAAAEAQAMTRVKADPRFAGTTAYDVQRRADEARRLAAEENPELVRAMKEEQ